MAAERLTDDFQDLSVDSRQTVSAAAHEDERPPQGTPGYTSTKFLCSRCLTSLSKVVTQFGDGSGYESLELLHSSSIQSERSLSKSSTEPCVICKKVINFFNIMHNHVALDASLRQTSPSEWSLTWKVEVDVSNQYNHPRWAFPHDEVSVQFTATHREGNAWSICGFDLHLDFKANEGRNWKERDLLPEEDSTGDYSCITTLDPPSPEKRDVTETEPEMSFYSTLSEGSVSLASKWILECLKNHSKCQRLFGGTDSTPGQTWFPDRLLEIKRVPRESENGYRVIDLQVRIVEKSDPVDFPPNGPAKNITYISLSHCWGPPPDPTAPLGGRSETVLTQSKLSAWKRHIPGSLPKTFMDAIKVCATHRFQYIWIDSLCIIQDSLEDWQEQSVKMRDVYKYAWMNIAALSSTSDDEGFINDHRDPRVEFGFRAPFAEILGREIGEKNDREQEFLLLRGRAKLLWKHSTDTQESNPSYCPLFERAWVYQERSLSRRTLAFSKSSIHWACDTMSRAERPLFGVLSPEGLRGTLHSKVDFSQTYTSDDEEAGYKRLKQLFHAFDSRWHGCVTAYTLCKLTRHTDKLIAFSAIAADLAAAGLTLKKRYLAGLWDFNLQSQLGWITVHGDKTQPRKMVGEEGYVAPSWSWASIDAPVQPCFIASPGLTFALADVLGADVALQTDYEYGSVKAGWIRISGVLNRVIGAQASSSISVVDQTTKANLWFTSDTVEGYELSRSKDALPKLRWMPLSLHFDGRMISCKALILYPVSQTELHTDPATFINPGDQVYRRLGTGNFGRIPSKIRLDKLLMNLGSYPDIDVAEGQGQLLARGFTRRKERDELVLV